MCAFQHMEHPRAINPGIWDCRCRRRPLVILQPQISRTSTPSVPPLLFPLSLSGGMNTVCAAHYVSEGAPALPLKHVFRQLTSRKSTL